LCCQQSAQNYRPMVCFLHKYKYLLLILEVVQVLAGWGLGQELAGVWAEESPRQVHTGCTIGCPFCTCCPTRSMYVQKSLGHHTAPIVLCRDLELALVHHQA